MAKNKWDKKETIIVILISLGGIAFTAASFCVYYLVKPLHPAILAVICVVDFLYTFFISSIACKYYPTKKWLLNGFLASIGYIAAFMLICVLICVYSGAFDLFKYHFLEILFYAIFTAPCIYIILPLILLCLAYA